jgi:hypothetical protein
VKDVGIDCSVEHVLYEISCRARYSLEKPPARFTPDTLERRGDAEPAGFDEQCIEIDRRVQA